MKIGRDGGAIPSEGSRATHKEVSGAARRYKSSLVRSNPDLMALEQRFMFDGAAVADAALTLGADASVYGVEGDLFADTMPVAVFGPASENESDTDLGAGNAAADTDAVSSVDSDIPVRQLLVEGGQLLTDPIARDTWQTALDQVARLLTELPDNPDYLQLLQDVFGRAQTDSDSFARNAADLATVLGQDGLDITVELRSNADLNGALAAYAAIGHTGTERIYVNADWINMGFSSDFIARVLLEEAGHALDQRLNGMLDSPGDEGELFAARLTGGDVGRIGFATDTDSATLEIEGKLIPVERAAIEFPAAYRVNTATTPAGKESNSHDYINTSLSVARISDDTNSNLFSGNDVLAIGIEIGGEEYYGWISRPIKVQGIVRGFYFWSDPDFTDLALASADGNKDGDANALDNDGFILVVDTNYFFNRPGASVGGAILNIGSSSDRVDAQLNAIITAAPTLTGDTATAVEAGGVSNGTAGTNPTGNVLTNDTAAGGGEVVVKVGTTAASQSVTAATTSANGTQVAGQYGTLTIGADGSYSYVVNNSNAAVQALRSTSNTLTDTFTYQMSANGGVGGTTTLTVTIQGANDNPVAANDYNVAKESLRTDNTAYDSTDPLGSKATGNVLSNDTDVDQFSETKTVSASQGSATILSFVENVSLSQLLFQEDSNGFNAVGTSHTMYIRIDGIYRAVHAEGGALVKFVSKSGTTTTTMTLSANPHYYLNGSSQQVLITNLNGAAVGFENSTNATENTNGMKTATITSATATGTTTVTVDNPSASTGVIAVGMTVTGTGIPSSTTVTAATYDGSGRVQTFTLDKLIDSTPGTVLSFTAALGTTMTGQYGSLVLAADGTYTYTPFANNDSLGAGQSGIDSFQYSMQDASGATSSATLQITVFGSSASDPNAVADTATAVEAGGTANGTAGTNPTGNLLSNDTTPAGSNSVSSARSSSVTSATAVTTNTQIAGQYGTLTLSSTGDYTYTVDNSNVAVQALRQSSATLTESFVYSIINTASGVDSSTLVVTIQGANDAPVATNDSATAIETSGNFNTTAGFNPSGNVLNNDTDVDDAASELVVASVRTGNSEGAGTSGTLGVALVGMYGSLTLNANGTWTYTVDNSNATVDALASGETLTDSFNYTVRDRSGTGLTDIGVLNVTIQGADDTAIPTVNNVFVNEASPYVVFTVSGAAGATVNLALSNSTGLASSDVTATLGTDLSNQIEYFNGSAWVNYTGAAVAIPVGGQLFVRMAVMQDNVHEGNESFSLTASTGSGSSTGIGTINDEGAGGDEDDVAVFLADNNTGTPNDPGDIGYPTLDDDRPTISVSSPTVSEGGTAEFTVSINKTSTADISFTPTVGSGTATVGTDTAAASTLEYSTDDGDTWTTVSGAVTIEAGTSSVKLRIVTTDDDADEDDETFTVSTGYISGTVTNQTGASGMATITDNDGAPTLSVNDITVNEATGTAQFTVTRSGSAAGAASVNYATSNGTAIAGSDYTATSGTVNFADGEITKTFTVAIINDNVFEGSETFNVTLSDAVGATISDSTGVGTIKDDGTGSGGTDNDTPTVSVSSPTITEGASAVFTVSLSQASTSDVSFTPSLSNGTATVGTDTAASSTLEVSTDGGDTWSTVSGPVTIAAGQTSLQLRIATTDDTLHESSETFTLSTGSITGTVTNSGAATGTATITDNDLAPTLSINDVTVNEAAGTATFTVTRSGATGATASVDYATSNGTATAGSDYTATSGTLNFAAGETTKTFTVAITNDNVFEGSETFNITLSNASGATISDSTGVGTIKDDGTGSGGTDNDTPTVSVSSPTITEGASAVFTVSLSQASTSDVSFTPSLSNGTATVGTDTAASSTLEVSTDGGDTWSTVSGPVTIAAGQTSLQLRIATTDDASVESDETFTLSTGSITGTVTNSGAATGVATITDNDGAPTLSVNDITVNEATGTAQFTVTRSGSAAGA
ncbi:MAG: Calx-beta domain-containing protein, partial [Gammaproteobacteria bacterium]|nr:Calx-beta domain-containing protein [Gammaproteobacteria bacterium]